jgi:hypothetical protein
LSSLYHPHQEIDIESIGLALAQSMLEEKDVNRINCSNCVSYDATPHVFSVFAVTAGISSIFSAMDGSLLTSRSKEKCLMDAPLLCLHS